MGRRIRRVVENCVGCRRPFEHHWERGECVRCSAAHCYCCMSHSQEDAGWLCFACANPESLVGPTLPVPGACDGRPLFG